MPFKMETNQFLYVFIIISTMTVSSHAAQSEFRKYFYVSETVEKSVETQWTGGEENPDVQTQYESVVTSPKDANYKLSYANYDITWKNFKLEHNKSYASTSEEEHRFAVFMDNVKTIERHNWQFHLGQSTYWMDINQFSDWTSEEFQAMLSPLDVNTTSMWAGVPRAMYEGASDVGVPSSIDWRSKGYVTPVKDQGKCGSCYSFSTTGSIEGQWYRKTQNLIPLSEQQILDCSSGSYNYGCEGGYVDASFQYIMRQGGLETESAYPYTGKPGSCNFQKSKAKVQLRSYKDVPGNENSLQTAVGNQGPVSVCITVTENFQHYRQGIFVDSSCRGKSINHAVLAVGYGSSGGSDYWIVKNSWNTSWGSKGYIYMARNRNNMCSIASMASFPVV